MRAPRQFWMVISMVAGMLLAGACAPAPQPSTATPAPTAVLPVATPTATLSAASVRSMPTPTLPAATVRVAHVLADGPSIDVQIDDEPVVRGMRYTTTTQPTDLIPGEHIITILTEGADTPLITQTISAAPQAALILVFTGTSDAPALGVYEEPALALDDTTSSVSLIHAIPRAPDIIARAGSGEPSSATAFGAMSPVQQVASGTQTFTFQSGDEQLLAQPVNLVPRSHYTFIVFGSVQASAAPQIIVLSRRVTGRALLRIANISPDAGALDVYLDGALYAQNVTYGRPTERREVFAQNYQLYFLPAGAPVTTQPIYNAALNAAEGAVITAVLLGAASDPRLVTAAEDLSLTRPGQARMVFLNALPNAPLLRGEIGGLTDLSYGQASPPLMIPAESVNFYWTLVENRIAGVRVAEAENVVLDAGRSYLYLITETSETQPPLIFSDAVGVDESLAQLAADVTPSPTPRSPTQLRFVNALDGSTQVDFLLGEVSIAQGLGYGQSSGFTNGAADIQTITLVDSSSGTPLASTDYTFRLGQRYSVYAYGFVGVRQGVLVVEDEVFRANSSSGLVRLVNLTDLIEVPFGLGTLPSANLPNAIQETYATRPAIFADMSRLFFDVDSKSASPLTLVPPGILDFFVIEDASASTALQLPNLTIEAGQVYEIVVYQALDSLLVGGFVLSYP